MFIALRELRRAKVRFGLLIGAIALLVFLILFQQSLQNGLITSSVGALRNQSAPVLVYSVDGQRVLQGSAITDELDQLVRSTPEVGGVGRIGQSTFTAQPQTPSGDSATFDATIIGYDLGPGDAGLGAPTTLTDGRLPTSDFEAVASDADADDGFGLGSIVRLKPGDLEITIVGVAEDARLNVTATLFTSFESFEAAVRSTNPAAGTVQPNALAVSPIDGVSDDELIEALNERSLDIDALSRSQAADDAPVVSQIQQSFTIIFALYGLVVPFVTGLFFLIVTLQKADALTLLRAIGAPRKRLVSALLFQVVVIVLAGAGIGIALYAPLSQQQLGGIPLKFETTAVVGWTVALLALGLLSSLLSARRVLRIDPVTATTGPGGAR